MNIGYIYHILLSQTAKDTFYVFFGNIFCAFLAFLYTIFLARSLSPSDFGIFSSVLAFTLLVSDVSDMGIGSSLSRFLPPLYKNKNIKKANSFIKTSFIFQMKVVFILTIAVISFSPILSRNLLKSNIYTNLFIISGLGILGTVLMTFSNFSLAAQQKFFQTSIISIISTLSKLIIIIALYLVNILNIFSATLAFTFSNFIAYIFSIKFLPFTFISSKQEKGDLKKLLSFSAFLGVSKIFSATASKVDALMLIPLSNSYEAGIYSGAYKIAFLYFLLSGSFSSVIAPRLSAFNTYKQASGYLKKTILFVILIILSMIILYIIAPWFIPFILGHNYNESVPVFRLLLFPMALFVLIIPPVNLLIYTYKKPQISTFNTFVQFLLIIIGNTYFIPKYFRYGPIISLSLAYGFTLTSASIFAIYYSKKYK